MYVSVEITINQLKSAKSIPNRMFIILFCRLLKFLISRIVPFSKNSENITSQLKYKQSKVILKLGIQFKESI